MQEDHKINREEIFLTTVGDVMVKGKEGDRSLPGHLSAAQLRWLCSLSFRVGRDRQRAKTTSGKSLKKGAGFDFGKDVGLVDLRPRLARSRERRKHDEIFVFEISDIQAEQVADRHSSIFCRCAPACFGEAAKLESAGLAIPERTRFRSRVMSLLGSRWISRSFSGSSPNGSWHL